eukprot:8903899-Alexandrium_andersonii.AAC.1
MSASLVGSEMCIRDSPVAPRQAELRGRPDARTSPPLSLEGPHRAHDEGCLLYTSDAADDM